MIKKLEPRHFSSDSGFGGATFSDVIDKVNEIIDAMNGEHDPADIYSEDGRLIAKKDESEDERIRKAIFKALSKKEARDVLLAEGVQVSEALAWLEKRKESLRDFIDDFPYSDQQEQKPSTGIYWHAIKKGDKIPCRAYLYKVAYETENNFRGRATIDGLLMPNIENVTCGCDTWYLPADDVKNLPREGLDELQKEQKPVDDSDFKTKLAEYMTKNRTGYSYSISSESILEMAKEELLKRGELKDPKPAWSEEDERMVKFYEDDYDNNLGNMPMRDVIENRIKFKGWLLNRLKSLRPGWKPSEDQMDALAYAIQILDDGLSPKAAKAGEELEHLREQLKKL